MLDNKIFYSLFGALVALTLVSKYEDTIEGYVHGNTRAAPKVVKPTVVRRNAPRPATPVPRQANISYNTAPTPAPRRAPVVENFKHTAPVSLPVADMTAVSEDKAPIVYDRVIYANKNSRLRAQGDMIRGDLPIVPNNSDWFRPSAKPSTALQPGAMNVIAGDNNETANALRKLMNA